MITEDYVSFETAKLLKEKGFDSVCENQYINCSSGHPFLTDICDDAGCYYKNSEIRNDEYSAPTLQTACKWLKEVHNIFIAPTVGESDGKFWYDADIIPINGKVIYWKSLDVQLPMLEEDSPEKAIEKALKYCLENLI